MITIKNITKSYPMHDVLYGVDLTCERGKLQALLGANGAGKSTLINIVSGLLKADQGVVCIDNEDISINNNSYRKKVGYVFEHPIYIEKFTAKEYLVFVAKMHSLTKDKYVRQIEELLMYLDLPTNGKKYIENYSKGMKSKVSLAAALIHQPQYLILDEPFDGLDFVSIQKITRMFKDLAQKGTTILVASHQFDTVADLCDSFALLKEGKIAFNLPMPALIEKATLNHGHTTSPVKSYLESLMCVTPEKKLSWI